jgi:tRNA G18 (ribose-2'-O)-methylase SpoU
VIKHRQLNHTDHINSGRKYPVIFVLDGLGDAVNVGSVFRLADALGIKKIYLTGKTPSPPDKFITRNFL